MIRNFHIAGRQSGKTHDILLRMLDGEDLLYVAPTVQQAMYAYNEAMRILEERGTTWDESVERRFRERFKSWEQAADPMLLGARRRPVAVDNVEMILSHLFGNIDTVTMSPPEHLHISRLLHIEGNPDV